MKGILPLTLPLTFKRLATRAVCAVCGRPMTAQNEREQALMNQHPCDGGWTHPGCRGKEQKR